MSKWPIDIYDKRVAKQIIRVILIGKSNSDWQLERVFLQNDFSMLNKALPVIDAFPELFPSKHSSSEDNFLKGVTDNGREGILPLTYDQLATACSFVKDYIQNFMSILFVDFKYAL